MKNRIRTFTTLLFLLANKQAFSSNVPPKKTVTDMAGRTVTVPAVINSVYSTSPMGEILMYTLAPEMITGTTWNLDSASRSLLLPVYNSKPLLGGWYGKNTTGNPEVIINAHPDVVLSMGAFDPTDHSVAERIGKQLGVPVLLLDGKMTMLDSVYRFMGPLLGRKQRADSLAAYCRSTLDTIAARLARIPADRRVRIYYAEGMNGLQTDPAGSPHAETIALGGGENVADVPLAGGYGRSAVSIEQVLVWNPEVILVCLDRGYAGGTGNYTRLLEDPRWRTVPAVQAGRVFQIPSLPFNWIDRPPSVNRIIGIRWITALLYPGMFPVDLRNETRHFYRLFYHRDCTDRELDVILKHALPRTGTNAATPARIPQPAEKE
jgi:iron complex transport system substrate-binding protein